MTYDGSNRKHIRAAEKQARIREAAKRNFVKSIMSQYDGRAWVHQLLLDCHIFSTSFAAGASDITSFRLGEQNIGLQLFNDIVASCPTEYVLMMQEANAKEVIDERRYSDTGRPEPAEPTRSDSDPRRDDSGSVADSGPEGDADPNPDGWYH